MSLKNESSKTMRIDIHPDFLGESLERKRQETQMERGEDQGDYLERLSREDSHGSGYVRLLESIYDAVLITGPKGRILDFSNRAMDFFLCDGSELSGVNIIDLISGADAGLLEEIGTNLQHQRYTLIEAHCIRRDRSMFAAEVAVNRIDLDERGQLCFLVRDITVRKQAQEALEDAVERLEEHDRARSQFVSNVSHELRTPLTSMLYAVANMLRGVAGPVPAPLLRYIEMLDGDCHRLLGTVNDILDLRKMDNRTLTLAKTRVSFRRIVQRSVQSFQDQAEQKGLALRSDSDSSHVFVECDVQKMERVVMNLVGNAIKFTPDSGSVEVDVTMDASEEFVVLRVRDSGMGIPEDAVARVTERYFTVGEQPSGSGLGLAICKEIAELHEGQLEIDSPPEGRENGTEVRVSLPRALPPTVLVVEDDADVREVLVTQISAQGYRVIEAENGVDAIACVQDDPPDLITLDLALPEMDGTELILRLKGDKKTVRIPIIVVTGAHVGSSKAKVLHSFGISAMRKPWKERVLLDRIEGAFLGTAAIGG